MCLAVALWLCCAVQRLQLRSPRHLDHRVPANIDDKQKARNLDELAYHMLHSQVHRLPSLSAIKPLRQVVFATKQTSMQEAPEDKNLYRHV